MANDIKPKKIHSTAILAHRCSKVNKDFQELIDKCKILDRYYIPPRYPVSSELIYQKQDANEAIEITKSIIVLISRLLK